MKRNRFLMLLLALVAHQSSEGSQFRNSVGKILGGLEDSKTTLAKLDDLTTTITKSGDDTLGASVKSIDDAGTRGTSVTKLDEATDAAKAGNSAAKKIKEWITTQLGKLREKIKKLIEDVKKFKLGKKNPAEAENLRISMSRYISEVEKFDQLMMTQTTLPKKFTNDVLEELGEVEKSIRNTERTLGELDAGGRLIRSDAALQSVKLDNVPLSSQAGVNPSQLNVSPDPGVSKADTKPRGSIVNSGDNPLRSSFKVKFEKNQPLLQEVEQSFENLISISEKKKLIMPNTDKVRRVLKEYNEVLSSYNAQLKALNGSSDQHLKGMLDDLDAKKSDLINELEKYSKYSKKHDEIDQLWLKWGDEADGVQKGALETRLKNMLLELRPVTSYTEINTASLRGVKDEIGKYFRPYTDPDAVKQAKDMLTKIESLEDLTTTRVEREVAAEAERVKGRQFPETKPYVPQPKPKNVDEPSFWAKFEDLQKTMKENVEKRLELEARINSMKSQIKGITEAEKPLKETELNDLKRQLEELNTKISADAKAKHTLPPKAFAIDKLIEKLRSDQEALNLIKKTKKDAKDLVENTRTDLNNDLSLSGMEKMEQFRKVEVAFSENLQSTKGFNETKRLNELEESIKKQEMAIENSIRELYSVDSGSNIKKLIKNYNIRRKEEIERIRSRYNRAKASEFEVARDMLYYSLLDRYRQYHRIK